MAKTSERLPKLFKSKTVVISSILVAALAVGGVVVAGQISAENDRIAALEVKRQEALTEKKRLESLFTDSIYGAAYFVGKTIEISSDKRSMYLDSWGNAREWTINDMVPDVTFEILDRLEIPAVVKNRMNTTNMLMGQQEANWGDLKASWTYSPGAGLDVSLEIVTPIPEIPEVK
jgi:hypothetical protein